MESFHLINSPYAERPAGCLIQACLQNKPAGQCVTSGINPECNLFMTIYIHLILTFNIK